MHEILDREDHPKHAVYDKMLCAIADLMAVDVAAHFDVVIDGDATTSIIEEGATAVKFYAKFPGQPKPPLFHEYDDNDVWEAQEEHDADPLEAFTDDGPPPPEGADSPAEVWGAYSEGLAIQQWHFDSNVWEPSTRDLVFSDVEGGYWRVAPVTKPT